MSERIIVTLEEAADFVRERSTQVGGPCNYCVDMSYDAAIERAHYGDNYYPKPRPVENADAVMQALRDHGWLHVPHTDGLYLPCSKCRVPQHPWIASLDVERVQTWLQVQFDKHGDNGAFVIDFEDLRRSCT